MESLEYTIRRLEDGTYEVEGWFNGWREGGQDLGRLENTSLENALAYVRSQFSGTCKCDSSCPWRQVDA